MIKRTLLYITVFTGCFFEGETSLITSSFAAHRGYLEIVPVMIIAFIATQSWDWLWFIIGRRKGRSFIASRPRLREKSEKVDRLLARHPVPLLLGYRFLYGFRTAVPLALGMSNLARRKFFIFGIINTLLWDILFSSIGFFFGAFLKANWKRIEEYELEVIALLIVSGIALGMILRRNSLRVASKNYN